MSELFIDVPETPLSPLQSARLRMDAAQAAMDAETAQFIPEAIAWEHRNALQALRHEEAKELKRLRE